MSNDPNLSVRVAWQRAGQDSLEFLSEPMKVGDMPKDPHFPLQVYVTADLDTIVTDPSTRFRVWTQHAVSGAILSPVMIMTSRSLDDPNEVSEPPVQESSPQPPPSQPRALTAAEERQRRRNPVVAEERRRQRLFTSYKRRIEQIQVLSRRIRRHDAIINRATSELQTVVGLLDQDVMQLVFNRNNPV